MDYSVLLKYPQIIRQLSSVSVSRRSMRRALHSFTSCNREFSMRALLQGNTQESSRFKARFVRDLIVAALSIIIAIADCVYAIPYFKGLNAQMAQSMDAYKVVLIFVVFFGAVISVCVSLAHTSHVIDDNMLVVFRTQLPVIKKRLAEAAKACSGNGLERVKNSILEVVFSEDKTCRAVILNTDNGYSVMCEVLSLLDEEQHRTMKSLPPAYWSPAAYASAKVNTEEEARKIANEYISM